MCGWKMGDGSTMDHSDVNQGAVFVNILMKFEHESTKLDLCRHLELVHGK
jgi:hypothetical protein